MTSTDPTFEPSLSIRPRRLTWSLGLTEELCEELEGLPDGHVLPSSHEAARRLLPARNLTILHNRGSERMDLYRPSAHDWKHNSVVCFLSNPGTYTGGVLRCYPRDWVIPGQPGSESRVVLPGRDKGTVVLMQNNLWRMFTPITAGVQRLLVSQGTW